MVDRSENVIKFALLDTLAISTGTAASKSQLDGNQIIPKKG